MESNAGSRKLFDCVTCSKKFSSKARLTFHIKNMHSVGEVQTVCDQCKLRFCSPQSLRRHFNTVHLGIKSHECCTCGRNFSNRSDMDNHIRQSHSLLKLKCPKCKVEFGYRSSLNRHLLSCRKQERDIICDICRKKFNSKNSLYSHKKDKHSSEVFICDTCAKCFNRKYDRNRHTRAVHKNDQ